MRRCFDNKVIFLRMGIKIDNKDKILTIRIKFDSSDSFRHWTAEPKFHRWGQMGHRIDLENVLTTPRKRFGEVIVSEPPFKLWCARRARECQFILIGILIGNPFARWLTRHPGVDVTQKTPVRIKNCQ